MSTKTRQNKLNVAEYGINGQNILYLVDLWDNKGLNNSVTVQVSAYQSGVSLVVDKAEQVTTVSLLLQTRARGELLAGVWECRPEMAPPAAILLHVIKGNKLSSPQTHCLLHEIQRCRHWTDHV